MKAVFYILPVLLFSFVIGNNEDETWNSKQFQSPAFYTVEHIADDMKDTYYSELKVSSDKKKLMYLNVEKKAYEIDSIETYFSVEKIDISSDKIQMYVETQHLVEKNYTDKFGLEVTPIKLYPKDKVKYRFTINLKDKHYSGKSVSGSWPEKWNGTTYIKETNTDFMKGYHIIKTNKL